MSDQFLGKSVVCQSCGEVLWNDEDETPANIALQAYCGAHVAWEEVDTRTPAELSELAATRCSFKAEIDAMREACLRHNEGVVPAVGQVWYDCWDGGTYLLAEATGDDRFSYDPVDSNPDPIRGATTRQLLEGGRFLFATVAE